jgi:hypothetical protein
VVARTRDIQPGQGIPNGTAHVWYHKHWRPVNHTCFPTQLYASAQLHSRLKSMMRDIMYAVSLHLMMHDVHHNMHGMHHNMYCMCMAGYVALDWRCDQRACLCAPRFDTSHHYSVASSHQQLFGSE